MITTAEQDEQELKLLDRIKKTDDGLSLIEYLKRLSAHNYRMFKKSTPDTSEFCKGYAVCIDSIVECFENCTNRLAALEEMRLAALDPEKTQEDGTQVSAFD